MSDESGSGAAGTVCPYCAVGCRLDREGERVVGRVGPANPGGRLCEKGLYAFDPVAADDRLTTPLVREDGELRPAAWDRALERAAAGLRGVRDAHGPDALAFLGAPRCTTEENYLLSKLARVLGTNNVDNRARDCHAATTGALAARLGWPATTNTLAGLRRAEVILVVGANPAVRQPIAFDSAVRPALKAGGTLVHVDPRENETTRPSAHHLAPRPGTDALVVSALCALALAADGVDADFVRERTTGAAAVRSWLDDLDPDAAATAADVDRDTLDAVAAAVTGADRVAVLTGTGADRRSTADALLNLLLLTGNLGRPGTGLYVLRGLANEQGAVDAGCVPDRLPGHRPVRNADARAALAEAWGVEVPATPGRTESALLSAAGEDVHAALVVGENPAVSKRDADRLADSLDALSTLVVAECGHSETTRHADVVLPAATGVEKAGTVTNLGRQIQRLRPRATPPGDARPDVDILRSLGRRLAGDGFAPDSLSGVFAEFARVAPPYAGIDYEGLLDRPRRWPTGQGAADGDRGVLYGESFATADGRAPLVVVDLPTGPEPPEGGLVLVVADRAGQFAAGTGDVDDRVSVHPEDAADNGLEDGMRVRVSTGAASVETTAQVSRSIRPGVVSLHASVADPLVRDGGHHVDVTPVD